MVTKAYWTLFIDILCIALDGNAFDTAWMAMLAALKQTMLPKAWWDADREMIVCSPRLVEATQLRLSCLPLASTFAVFSTASPLKSKSDARNWILADPDGFEEDVTAEILTVVVTLTTDQRLKVLRLEKSGGSAMNKAAITSCIDSAKERCKALTALMGLG